MKKDLALFLKGVAMGAANVIPGVSGGTIAFVTGIYDELISSLKAFDAQAIKLVSSFKIKELLEYINAKFLLILFVGIGISLVTLGKVLKYLFETYSEPVWAFFFGLILASVYFVGRTIKEVNTSTIVSFLLGTGLAIALALVKPAAENDALWYLFICGIVATASMLLPGLSGSFVLILLGNYQLIMLNAVPDRDLKVIGVVGIGAVVGFVVLSRIIHFLMHKYESPTLGGLTGFILGSLLVIWPWKSPVFLKDEGGQLLLKKGKEVVMGYEWFLPELNLQTGLAVLLMIVGVGLVWLLEAKSLTEEKK